LKGNYNDLKTHRDDIKSEHDEKKKELFDVKAKLSEIEAASLQLKRDKAELETLSKESDKEQQGLLVKLSDLENKFKALDEDHSRQRAKIALLEDTAATATSVFSVLGTEHESLKLKHVDLSKELTESITKVENYELGKDVLKKEKEDLEAKSAAQEARIIELELKMKEQEKALATRAVSTLSSGFNERIDAFSEKMGKGVCHTPT
jgi:chromosome segregation ATPase